ncbi:MAG: peptidylprolyl isomerase [Halioglobus sp.]
MFKMFKWGAVLLGVMLYATMAVAEKPLKPEEKVLDSPSFDVTVDDIERYMVENLPPDSTLRQGVLNRPGVYREMAENLYIIRALANEAEKQLGFDRKQAEWAGRMAYERRLMEQYRAIYIRDALAKVDWDGAALEFYRANPDRYKRGEIISAAHILVKPQGRSKQEALELANTLYERIKAGEDFGTLAKEFSDDGSASNGGELGFFQRGKMVAPFEEAAFALKNPGDLSEPVESIFGYHIIILRDRKPAGSIPFEEVKDGIIESLERKMGNQVWQDRLVQLRSSKDLQLDEEILAALRKKYVVNVGDVE